MKGVDWTYCGYGVAPSNLSAFAAPFSVNRYDVSAPFVDVESAAAGTVPVPPTHFASYGYDFLSDPNNSNTELNSSKPFGYLGFQGWDAYNAHFPQLGLPPKHDFSYDLMPPKPSLVEAQRYCSPFVSSPIHDHSSSVAPNHWSSSSGIPPVGGDYANPPCELGFGDQSSVVGNQHPEFNGHGKGKQVGLESSFSSVYSDVTGSVGEERATQGYQDLNNNDWEKHSMPANLYHLDLDEKSCCWGTVKPTPIDFSGTFLKQSYPVSLETHHEEGPLKSVADSGNGVLSYSSSYDKHWRHGDQLPRVDTVSSVTQTGLVPDLNIGDGIADRGIEQSHFGSTEACHKSSPGTAHPIGSRLVGMHLDINLPFSSKNEMVLDKTVSRDVSDHVMKGRHGFQNPANMDNLSLRFNATEDVNSVDKSFEGGDRCNPALDSPCRKGASAHISQFECCEPLPPVYMPKNEVCFGSVIQEPQKYMLNTENNVKISCKNSNSYQMHAGNVYHKTNSAGFPKKLSATWFSPEVCKSGFPVSVAPFQIETSCYSGHLGMNGTTEMKKNSVQSAKLTDCESGFSHAEYQVVEENELKSQKQNTSSIVDANAGCNGHKCLEYGTSQTAERTLPSPIIDITTTPENSFRKVSTKNLDVQMLLDTMRNLSELLLCHCLNNACELNERECNVLKNVISNLNSSFKRADQIVPDQGLSGQSETSSHSAKSHELQQSASLKRPQLTKIEFENPLVAEATRHFRSMKPQGKLSISISPSDDDEKTKTDNMTEALKRILSENFHDDEEAEPQTVLYKNLWLEAEAALCSVYYKARYNQMKIEMDKYSYKERDMEEQLSQILTSATKVNNYPKPDSSAHDLPVLHATNLKDLSHLKSSTDMNYPQAMTHREKDGPKPDGFIQNNTVSSTDNGARGHDDATVMVHFSKARADQSLINTVHLGEPSDIGNKLVHGSGGNKNQVNICQDSEENKDGGHDEASVMARYRVLKTRDDKSLVDAIRPEEPSAQNQINICEDSEKNKGDYEASVLARFHILKSLLEDSSYNSSEGELLKEFGSVGKGMNDTASKNSSECKSSDFHVNPDGLHLNSTTAVDKSIPKEIHLDWEDNQEMQPFFGTHEFQPPDYYSDGFASDWEHVEKSS